MKKRLSRYAVAAAFLLELLWLVSLPDVRSEGAARNIAFTVSSFGGFIMVGVLSAVCIFLLIRAISGRMSLQTSVITYVSIIVGALLVCRYF